VSHVRYSFAQLNDALAAKCGSVISAGPVTLVGKVGINDDVPPEVCTDAWRKSRMGAIVFGVRLGAPPQWQSKPIRTTADTDAVRYLVPVSHHPFLDLVVEMKGHNGCAHAVWIEPQLCAAGAEMIEH
jgi:hypothetical protein